MVDGINPPAVPSRRPPIVAVLLAGCGVHDGSEVHETVLALLALERAGARALCTAPNVPQGRVINHATGEPSTYETRSVLVESARLARGPVADLATVTPRDFDALFVPGGYGVTTTLCDYAARGRGAAVLPDVARVIRDAHAARKPMAFVCTAPVLAARVLGASRPTLTIGQDAALAADLEAWGAVHRACDARNIVVDREQRVVSSPAYLLARGVADAAHGIDRAVRALLELV
jgi:enhancing lycopene biosynthesis protein 2